VLAAHPDSAELSTEAVELVVADAVGELMELWGFRRPLGRMWTLLYLSPEPLPAAVVAARLRMSAGAVSMTAAELERWGVIHRAWRPHDRRDYFSAETNIWKMVRRVLRERELQVIRRAARLFRQSQLQLQQGNRRRSAGAIGHKLDRVAMLLGLARLGERLLMAVVNGEPVYPASLERLCEEEPWGQSG
jgi:DNA-binding transcriptional regulator GbsR (MarR family)